MSKKKNFKGVASKIVKSPVSSLDDFLGAEQTEDPKPANTKVVEPDETDVPDQKSDAKQETKPARSRVGRPRQTTVATQSTQSHNTPPIRRKPKKKVPIVQEEPEKIRVSLVMPSRTSFELDELKMKIRQMAPRQDMARITKSSIVEAAIDIIKAEFDEYGIDSDVVQHILK